MLLHVDEVDLTMATGRKRGILIVLKKSSAELYLEITK